MKEDGLLSFLATLLKKFHPKLFFTFFAAMTLRRKGS